MFKQNALVPQNLTREQLQKKNYTKYIKKY